jgi:hypothetical protein
MIIPEGRWRFRTAEVGHVQGHEADATNEALRALATINVLEWSLQ